MTGVCEDGFNNAGYFRFADVGLAYTSAPTPFIAKTTKMNRIYKKH
jgi:hypothetical protein